MEQAERYPSYIVSVATALSTSTQPLSVDAIMEEVRGKRPVSSSMRTAVHRALRQLYQAVPVGEEQYGWLTHLLQNNIYRHPLSAEEVRRGFVLLDELEHAVFFPQFFQTHRPDSRHLRVELMGGPTLECEAAVEHRTWSIRLGVPFVEWIDDQGGTGHDDLIIMVVDAKAGHYLLRLQPREARDEEQIQERNIAVVEAAEQLVAELHRGNEPVPTWELAALLIGRLLFVDATPPDDMHLILQRYSSLALVDGTGYVLKDAPEATSASSGSKSRSSERSSYAKSRIDEPAGQPVYSVNGSSEDEMDFGPEDFDGASTCQDYEEYLEQLSASGRSVAPLSHSDYHLLEAELEMLISLEQEFGYLLPEQQVRVDELAARLYIDPEVLRSSEQDMADDDFDGPQFWQN